MSSSARGVAVNAGGATLSTAWALAGILGMGLVARLFFINAEGFHNDVAAFESWTLTLMAHPTWGFYANASFADYPPGYFFVLWILGRIYGAITLVHADPSYAILRALVKTPAIAMDLVDALLVFGIVRRFASTGWALGAAALLALNPAAIYVSSYWGQVDSVSAGLALAGIFLLLRADGDERIAPFVIGAWLALGASILIKPQALVIAALFVAFPFATRDAAVRLARLRATAGGIVAAFVLAYLAGVAFHPSANPIEVFAWIYARYAYGSSVYAYTSVNAFNLYAIFHHFWESDQKPFGIGSLSLGAEWLWGIVLVLAATVLVVARYLEVRTPRALVEGALLLALAFFCLSTRMHERYLYDAFVLSIAAIGFGRAYLYSALVLSGTLLANLIYSFAYQAAMEQRLAGVDATNLWPGVSSAFSALNVAVFFVLGYMYFGGTVGVLGRAETQLWSAARPWFAPFEGLARMSRRDALLAGTFTVLSFVICLAWYQFPAEKIFDEIYYARAGEEYLRHVEIFEFTHPPLTKLIVTVSMLLFGGLSHLGDSGFGWRFLNIVIGALTVTVIYAFAKRFLGSTLFAAIAAGMLVFDGFHFVQSRIATPEIGVAFFSLLVLYAFYRYWIASQVRVRAIVPARFGRLFYVLMAFGVLVSAAVASVATNLGYASSGPDFKHWTFAVAFLYTLGACYLLARLLLPRFLPSTGKETSYGEGSRVQIAGSDLALMLPTGQVVRPTGDAETLAQAGDGDLRVTYQRDGTMTYATPEGAARYLPSGRMENGLESVDAVDAWRWLGVLAICAGLLAASKWNGLFDFFVVWFLAAFVAAQRFLRRPALFGNPYGIPVDIVVVLMGVVGATIYLLAYIPYMTLGHNLVDIVSLQHDMYRYHATLKATHPYQSVWWQWPFILRPIAYYYHDFRSFAQTQAGAQCCVAEILALPNPIVWWFGLISVPFAAIVAWRERNRGCTLLVTAYFLQWLPWIGSPRIAFEYHFYPNLSIIVLANALLLQRLWAARWKMGAYPVAKYAVAGYLVAVVAAFGFFYPILAGVHVPYDVWHARMWLGSWI